MIKKFMIEIEFDPSDLRHVSDVELEIIIAEQLETLITSTGFILETDEVEVKTVD